MEKRKIIRLAWLISAVFWMALIFGFSHQKADASGEVSETLAYQVVGGVNEAAGMGWEEETLLLYAQAIEHPLRKAAHMTEYAVLACLLLGNFSQHAAFQKFRFAWAQLFASLYAATDEFHQLFIDGRSGELKDVAIDSAGAFSGLLAAWAVLSVWNKMVQKRKR